MERTGVDGLGRYDMTHTKRPNTRRSGEEDTTTNVQVAYINANTVADGTLHLIEKWSRVNVH